MDILITNDDSIDSSGIRLLAEAAAEVGNVSIVAPEADQSGKSLGINYLDPILVQKVDWGEKFSAWKVAGSPADCVKLALGPLLEKKPDLILSGVNFGSNSGRTVLYSGTVGGAIEGVMQGIPSIAFSCCQEEGDLTHVKPYLAKLIKGLYEVPFRHGTLFNVNFPCHDVEEFRGIKYAKQGRGYWIEKPVEIDLPGGTHYHMAGKWAAFEEDPKSDVALLLDGFITAVPIHVGELTDHDHYTSNRERFENINQNFLLFQKHKRTN